RLRQSPGAVAAQYPALWWYGGDQLWAFYRAARLSGAAPRVDRPPRRRCRGPPASHHSGDLLRHRLRLRLQSALAGLARSWRSDHYFDDLLEYSHRLPGRGGWLTADRPLH